MAMIQGIDGMALINAFRAGKQDRFEDAQREAAMRAAQQKAENQRRIQGVMGQVFGGQGGSMADMAGAVPQAVGGGIGGGIAQQRAEMDQGGLLPALPEARPAPQAPQAGGSVNYQALGQLLTLDPEMGGKIVTAFKAMDETRLKALDAKNMAMAQAAHYLETVPAAQRTQAMQSLIGPHLAAAGWTPQELQQADLSDGGLKFYQARGMDMDKLLAAELAERKFQAGDIVTPQPGAGVFRVRPTGDPETIVAPNDGSHAVGSPVTPDRALPSPKSKQDYDALAPGAQYIAPDGSHRTKPGGGSGNATGGFQP